MVSDALGDSDMGINSGLSTPSTTSDDNDAVNTESARVYFGPVQSPEKKFAPELGDMIHTPRLRRSSRLSHANRSLLEERSDEEDMFMEPVNAGAGPSGQSRDGTPVNDFSVPDEPSSVLASKILRAHDNPSPPPSSPPLEYHNSPQSHAVESDLLVDIFDTPIHNSACAQDGPTDLDIPNTILNPSPQARMDFPHSPVSFWQQPVPGPNVSQQDLINFDSFSAPSGSPPASNPPLVSSIATLPTKNASGQRPLTTVDDLLSLSPVPSPSAPRSTTEHDVRVPEIATPSVDEEEQVLQVLSQDIPAPSSPLGPAFNSPLILEPMSEVRTPVRRSTRPRRSCSPLISNVPSSSTSPGKVTFTLSAASGAPASQQYLAPPTSLVIKKKAKDKGREISLISETDDSGGTEPSGSGVNGGGAGFSVDTILPAEPSLAIVPDSDSKNLEEREVAGTHRRTPAAKPPRLGSLSPGSAEMLEQLLPNTSGSGDSSSFSASDANGIPRLPALFPSQITLPSTSSVPPQGVRDVPSTPSNPPDANRSPARRIPIAQAIAQGTFSVPRQDPSYTAGTSKFTTGPGVGLLGSPVFKRPALDDPTRSPAKRVPISQLPIQSPGKGKAPVRFGSPVRPAPRERERSGSAELRPLAFQRGRSGSAEPSRPSITVLNAGKDGFFKKPASTSSLSSGGAGTSAIAEKPKNTLPYPIIAASSRIPTSIPEAEEGEASPRPFRSNSLPPSSPATSSPLKSASSLRQPSVGAGSRIPRIGAKPYARPKATQSDPPQDTKRPVVPRRAKGAATSTTPPVPSGSSARPLRMVRHATSSGSSSDEGNSRKALPGRVGTGAHHTAASTPVAKHPTVSSLKRKRDGEKSRASPPGAQPIVVIRKVVPGMFNKTQPSPGPSVPAKEPARDSSPQKVQGRIQMRKVADWKRPQPEQPSSEDPQTPLEGTAPSRASAEVPSRSTMDAGVRDTPGPSSSSYHPARVTSPPVALEPDDTRVHPVASTSPSETQSTDTRRTTRSRRHADVPSDVFGTVAPAERPRRRRVIPAETSPFAGMSALALRSLTTSNTNKNQHHVVDLQTEIIRKEGARPGSPTTRVRTVLDRQKAAKAQEREERAKRRARRSDGVADDEPFEREASNGLGDESMLTVDADGVPTRHRRAPGDEEDYETPPRPDRPSKRGRFENGMEVRDEKRVKWDRGLATTVYLDDTPRTPRRSSSAEVIKKGCLTPAAKSLRLDTLGNVLNADMPLGDIVPENVVVKKFVYDDDDLPSDPLPEAIVPPLVIKPRSKSKKSKS